MKKPDKSSPDKEMLKAFEAAGLVDYLEYIQSGKRIMAANFKAGVARGLGITVGMSLVLGIVAWVLTLLVDLPVVGEYAAQVEAYMNEYRESTNYNDDFEKMNELLRHIEENTKEPGALTEAPGSPSKAPDFPVEAPDSPLKALDFPVEEPGSPNKVPAPPM